MTEAEDIKQALDVLRAGGIILYPTDTVWGIGCDATNADAVEKIYKLKQRSDAKAMISLVDGEGMLQRTVNDIPDAAWQLIDVAVRPLTIIYDQPTGLAPNLLAEDGSAGIRITGEKISRNLCTRLRHPLVSTSANISGKAAPKVFAEIAPEIIEGVDYVMQSGRTNPPARPSDIIKVSAGNVIKIIR